MPGIEFDNSARFLAEHTRAHERAVQRVLGVMRRGAPVEFGRLRGSLTSRPVQRGGPVSDLVGSALRYARMREFGGTIVPVRASHLVFYSRRSGRWAKVKRVTQRPGGYTQGFKPWMRPAVQQYPRLMGEEVRRIRL